MSEEMSGGAMLASMMSGEEAPQEEVAQEPTPEPAPQPQAPQMPQFDPSIMIGALDNIHGRLDEFGQKLEQPQQPQPQPSEEDLVIQEVAKKLGLDKVTAENQELKSTLQQMQESVKQQQEFIQKQQIEHTQNQILSKYEGITKDAVMNKLVEFANQYGEEFATSLNNPQGWDYVISNHLQAAQSKPDPIVSTEAGGADEVQSVTERVRKGQIQEGDLGAILASYF